MTKSTALVSTSDRHTAFRARAQEALRERVINGRVVLVSTLLAPAGSSSALSHGARNGYSEYMCRCPDCSRAYSEYRQELRESNLRHRKETNGRLVSTLLGSKGYPKHGVTTGTYWYGCECSKCRKAKQDSREGDSRAVNLTHLVPREDDGVLVSTLLGTDGNPDHGTYSGADWYGCWCEECRAAKNTLARLCYQLRRNWPQETAERGAVSELAREILAAWNGEDDKARARIETVLNEHYAWSGTDSIPAMAEKLADTVSAPPAKSDAA